LLIGGKTRLARALAVQARAAGTPVRVLHRSPAEQTALMPHYPAAELLSADALAPAGAGHPWLGVVVCALGAVHPGCPAPATDLAEFSREAAALGTLPGALGPGLHVVLVSSVLALAPQRDRSFYGGSKNLAEATCASVLRDHPNARLSVVYPGRLVEARHASQPGSWLATPYRTLSLRLLMLLRHGQPVSRTVGLDARLWLLAAVPRMLCGALLPQQTSAPLAQRDQTRPASQPHRSSQAGDGSVASLAACSPSPPPQPLNARTPP
jgi:hypothetical protein